MFECPYTYVQNGACIVLELSLSLPVSPPTPESVSKAVRLCFYDALFGLICGKAIKNRALSLLLPPDLNTLAS